MAASRSNALPEAQEIERLKEELVQLQDDHENKIEALTAVRASLDETKKEKKAAFAKLPKSDDISLIVLGASVRRVVDSEPAISVISSSQKLSK